LSDAQLDQIVARFSELRLRHVDTWDPPSELTGDSPDVVRIMRALTLLADERDRRETRVCAAVTSPALALEARRISSVLQEMVDAAETEVIVLGYELSDTPTVERLARRASLGVRVDLIVDASQTSVDRLRETWPAGGGMARIFRTTADPSGRMRRLHAKCVIADGRQALVGSANFTRSGLGTNLELAVSLEGPEVRRLRALAVELIEGGLVSFGGELGGDAIGEPRFDGSRMRRS
jgi:phosphatidylserine/phosphatidylglycerophosphate/cardiolipin synthase-like enzyme